METPRVTTLSNLKKPPLIKKRLPNCSSNSDLKSLGIVLDLKLPKGPTSRDISN